MTALQFMEWLRKNLILVLHEQKVLSVVPERLVTELVLSLIKESEKQRWEELLKEQDR